MKKQNLNKQVSRIKKMMGLNEGWSNPSNLIRRWNDELESAVRKLSKVRPEDLENLSPEKEEKLIKNLNNYDDNVLDFIEDMVYSQSVSKDEIVDFAIENEDRYGTEPQFVIFAIDDFTRVLGVYDDEEFEDEEEEDDDEDDEMKRDMEKTIDPNSEPDDSLNEDDMMKKTIKESRYGMGGGESIGEIHEEVQNLLENLESLASDMEQLTYKIDGNEELTERGASKKFDDAYITLTKIKDMVEGVEYVLSDIMEMNDRYNEEMDDEDYQD